MSLQHSDDNTFSVEFTPPAEEGENNGVAVNENEPPNNQYMTLNTVTRNVFDVEQPELQNDEANKIVSKDMSFIVERTKVTIDDPETPESTQPILSCEPITYNLNEGIGDTRNNINEEYALSSGGIAQEWSTPEVYVHNDPCTTDSAEIRAFEHYLVNGNPSQIDIECQSLLDDILETLENDLKQNNSSFENMQDFPQLIATNINVDNTVEHTTTAPTTFESFAALQSCSKQDNVNSWIATSEFANAGSIDDVETYSEFTVDSESFVSSGPSTSAAISNAPFNVNYAIFQDQYDIMHLGRLENSETRVCSETPIANVNVQNSSNVIIGNVTTYNIINMVQPVTEVVEGRNGIDGISQMMTDNIGPSAHLDVAQEEIINNLNESEDECIDEPPRLLPLYQCSILCEYCSPKKTNPDKGTQISEDFQLLPQQSPKKTPHGNGNTPACTFLSFVTRNRWLAQPPTEITPFPALPTYVIISHTATEASSTMAKNICLVRDIQSYHIDGRGWADIAYNFLIGRDCQVYEGRGWFHVGAHTLGLNCVSIGVAFIGCYNTQRFTSQQFTVLSKLLENGVRRGYLPQDYKLAPHSQFRPVDSPGKNAVEFLKNHPNWTPSAENFD